MAPRNALSQPGKWKVNAREFTADFLHAGNWPQNWTRMVVGSNPIWNSDFFRVRCYLYLINVFVTHFGGWLVASLMCQSSFGCVTARCGSSQKPIFHPCPPQSPSSSVVTASVLEHGGSRLQIPSGTRIFFWIWCYLYLN